MTSKLGRGAALLVACALFVTGCSNKPNGRPSSTTDLATIDPSEQIFTPTLVPSPSSAGSASGSTAAPSTISSSVTTMSTISSSVTTAGSGSSSSVSTGPTALSSATPPSSSGGSLTSRSSGSPGTARSTAPSGTNTGTAGISSSEAADRKAIEAAWLRYWKVFTDMMTVPKNKRTQAYGAVAVNPQLAQLIKLSAENDRDKFANYGTVVHRISWGPPIGGKTVAVMEDCQDQRKFGVYDEVTKTPLSAGFAHTNIQVTFQKGSSDWKVAAVLGLEGKSC